MKRESKIILIASFIGAAISLGACRSNDLGSAEADRVPVNLSLTGWDSGAGAVIAQKCANCHTSQRSASVPANTPDHLNGIESIDFFKNPKNVGRVRSMRKRIESTDPNRQMPPRFATPLYDDEKAAVLAFLKSFESGDAQPCSKDAALTQLRRGEKDKSPRPPRNDDKPRQGDDDDDHGGHHDDDGQPSPGPSPSTPSQDEASYSNPCSNPNPNPNPNSTPNPNPSNPSGPTPLPADIAPIVERACGVCHDGDTQISLKTREDFVAVLPTAIEYISTGYMPQGNAAWKDSADGQKVLQWLRGLQKK